MELTHIKVQIMVVGLLVLAAYLGGLVARKLKIGEVIGQIFGGIIISPHFLYICRSFFDIEHSENSNFLIKSICGFYKTGYQEYAKTIEDFHFFVFLFLGIIAFSIGEELHRDRIKKVGIKAIIICLIQAFLTFTFLAVGFYFFIGFSGINSLLIGSIGIATAPALTFILMNKLKIEGKLRNILANIVVLDDVIEVIFFSIFLGIAVILKNGKQISFISLFTEVSLELFFASLIGIIIFFILKFTLHKKLPEEEEEEENEHGFLGTVLSDHPTPSVEILLIILGILALGISAAIHFHLPFLITAVVAGFLIANFHSHVIFASLKIENVMPIFNLLFFALIGATIRLESFNKESIIFILVYLVLRTLGKLLGNWGACKITKQDPKITACLPKLMLPQAGMAAVETILVATVLKDNGGLLIFDTIIPALVVFELGGAWLSEKTLRKWKSWIVGEREALNTVSEKKLSDQTLEELLSGRTIYSSALNQSEVLNELTQLFLKDNIVNCREDILTLVYEREKLASTSIGKGIAIPHCRLDNIDKTYVAFCKLKESVDWKSQDGTKVSFVFLVISPTAKPEQHLKALRIINQELYDPEKKCLKEPSFQF